MKRCVKCGEEKPLSEFSENKIFIEDNKGKICRDCAAKYYQEHKKRQIEKYGREGYYEVLWEKRLRNKASKEGIPSQPFDYKKIRFTKWKMAEYPDKAFPDALTHIEFMKKYNLSVNEYIYIRQRIKKGEFKIG